MSTLFISHKAAERDNRIAKEIEARLSQEQGHESVFLDLHTKKGIVGGRSWEQTLYRKVRACRAVVALLGNEYLKSHWCFAELALSRMEQKHLIALEIEELDPELVPQILTGVQRINYHADPEEGFERLVRSLEELDLLGVSGEWDRRKSPYLGLRTFQEKHSALFFGRGEEASEGVRLLERGAPGLFMVLGSSGSGKSSLVRAGMIPRLRRDEDRWLIVGPFRPRRDPSGELADALADAWDRYAGDAAETSGIRARLRRRLGAGAAGPEGSEAAGTPAALDDDERVHRLIAQLEELAGTPPEAAGAPLRSFLDLSLEELREICAGRPMEPSAAAAASGTPLLVELADDLRRASGHKEANVLLVVDQFEEALGTAAPAEAAGPFLTRLRRAVEHLDGPVMVLGTMRSDFLELFQRNPELQGIDFQKISVGPMDRQDMRQIIKEPARLGEVTVSDELVEQLLDDTGTPDALPLLSFTLAALWEKRDEQGRLSEDRYELMGGLEGAVAREAQEILDSFDPEERDRLRQAFLEMARTEGGRYARRPVSWTDEKIARVEPVLRRFEERRLLVTGGDNTVEVAHEALFRSWPPLEGWLDQHRSEFLLKEQLERDADAWVESGRSEGMLWRGGRLQQAVELRDGGQTLSEAQAEFVRTSDDVAQAEARAEEERRRRELEQAQHLERAQRRSAKIFKRAAVLIGLALLVVAGGLWYAIQKKREAEDQTRVAVARNWLGRDPTRAALVLLEVRDPDRAASTVALLSQALREPLALAELRGHTDEVTAVAFDPRGGRIVSASRDRTARVWRLGPDGLPAPPGEGDAEPVVLPHPHHVLAAAFSPDGRIVTGSRDGVARIWNADGAPIRSWPPGQDAPHVEVRSIVLLHGRDQEDLEVEVTSVAFSPDGRRIVTGSNDGTARVWNADGTPYIRPPGDGSQVVLDLRPLVSDPDDRIRAGVNGVDFSPDGRRIVTAVNDKTAWIWSIDSGDPASPLEPRHGEAVSRAVFLPLPAAEGGAAAGNAEASDRIATTSGDDTARIWTRSGQSSFASVELKGHGGDVYGVAASPAGDLIVTVSDDRRALLWDADGRPVMSTDGTRQMAFRHEGEVTGAAFSPAGDRLATAAKDHSIRLWSLSGGLEPVVLPQPRAASAFFRGADEVVVTSAIGAFDNGAFGPPFFLVWRPGNRGQGSRGGRESWSAEAASRRFEFAELPPEVPERWTLSTVFSPAGDRVVTVSLSGTARLWHADATPVERPDGAGQVVLGQGQAVTSVAFSPSGDRIVTASKDGKARVWNADGAPYYSDGRQIVLDHGTAELKGAVFGPQGERILTAAVDGTARLWPVGGRPVGGAIGSDVMLPHEDPVLRAVMSPAGDLLATTSGSSTRLWHAGGKPVASTDGGRPTELRHENSIMSVAFSPEGDRIVTGSQDETARVWRTDGGPPIVLPMPGGHVIDAVFSPAGDRAVTTRSPTEEDAPPSGALIWRLSYDSLGATARAATAVCLDPAFRARSLREDPAAARERYDRCRRCVETFDGPAAAADPVAAFTAYRDCSRGGFFSG